MERTNTQRVIATACLLLALVTAPATAGVTVIHRAGGWSDVVRGPDGFLFVRATSSDVVTERPDGTLRWRVQLPEPILYLRAAADAGGSVQAVAQGNHSGTAYVIAAAGVTALGPSFGQNATAIHWSPSRGFAYYVQTSAATYAVYRDGGGCDPCVVLMPATSQGFRDIQPDGTVRRGDDYMTAPFMGRQFWSFAQRGDVTVGQCDPPGICALAGGRVFTLVVGNAFEPHLAVDGATFAVATRTEFGAALAIVTPPYPPADDTEVPPAPPAPPPPPPAPAPQARLAPNAKDTVAAVIAAHPEIDSCDEDRRGALVDYAAQRLNTGGPRVWGRKSRGKPDGDRAVNPNTDGLTFLRPDGTFEIYDVISGGGACGATWDGFGPFAPGENGFWAPPQLGPEPTPGGGPVTPPSPPPATGVTRAELDAAIRAAITQLHTDLWNEVDGADRDIRNRLERLEAGRPLDLVGLQAAIDAALATYEVHGKTRVSGWHQHDVKLAITRKDR